MKSIRNSFFSFAAILLIGQTCAKDSDEVMDETETYTESMTGQKKEVVEADWKKFMPLAHDMISIAGNNLLSLRVKLQNVSNSDEKIKYNIALQKGEYRYEQLQEKLERRNLQFKDELKNYDGSSGKKNTEFKTAFLHDIIDLNNDLEDLVDN